MVVNERPHSWGGGAIYPDEVGPDLTPCPTNQLKVKNIHIYTYIDIWVIHIYVHIYMLYPLVYLHMYPYIHMHVTIKRKQGMMSHI